MMMQVRMLALDVIDIHESLLISTHKRAMFDATTEKMNAASDTARRQKIGRLFYSIYLPFRSN